jgi:hypothetical protein
MFGPRQTYWLFSLELKIENSSFQKSYVSVPLRNCFKKSFQLWLADTIMFIDGLWL